MSVPAIFHWASLAVYELLLPPDAPPSIIPLLRRIVHDFIFSKFFLRDDPNLYQKFKGTSTGYFLTAIFNSLSHWLIHVYITTLYAKQIALPPSLVIPCNLAALYGDDKLSKKIPPYPVPYDFYVQNLNQIGMRYKPGSKSSVNISSHPFLKMHLIRKDSHWYPV
jgi:hypothetical protein